MQPPVVGALIVASVALLVGTTSSLITLLWNKRNHVTSILPALVFSRNSDGIWVIDNVGRGPALNVVLGDGSNSGDWGMVVSCYPVAAGARVPLPWLRSGGQLLVQYQNCTGRSYWSRCIADITTTGEGMKVNNWKITRRQHELDAGVELERKQRDWGVR